MLELYEGKTSIDVTSLSDNTRKYLVEFKEELNKHIYEKTRGKKAETRTNAQIHRDNLGR